MHKVPQLYVIDPVVCVCFDRISLYQEAFPRNKQRFKLYEGTGRVFSICYITVDVGWLI